MPLRSLVLSSLSAFLAVLVLACTGSDSNLDGVGEEFDIAGFSEDVFRLCETAQCSDYSEAECKFFLRYDVLELARLSEDPEACFDAYREETICLADAASCYEESCYAPRDACEIATEAPVVNVPEAVRPTDVACEFRTECDAEFFEDEVERDFAFAACQVEYVTRTEILLHDEGPACAQAFIDFLVCIGESETVPCDPSGREEEEACPEDLAAFEAECFGP